MNQPRARRADAAAKPAADDTVVALPERPPAPKPPAGGLPQPDEEGDLRGFPIDRLVHAWQAQFTGGLSPAAMLQAFADWGIHLLNAPGKRADLIRKAFRKWVRFIYYAARAPQDAATPPAIEPLPGDRRCAGPD